MRNKIVTAAEAVAVIQTCDALCTSGYVGIGVPDAFLVALHLLLEAQHLGFVRPLLGQRLGRARRELFIAPLAQLAGADIQLRSGVGEWQATLDQALNRLGLVRDAQISAACLH